MKFFVVDDDPDALSLVECLLVKAGHAVVTCGSSTDALRDIPSEMPDCVITDLMMPGMTGVEVMLSAIAYDKYGGRVRASVADKRGDIARALLAEGFARPYRGERRGTWCGAA